MKKKIGFFIASLGIGGIEKALLSMVKVMDKQKYDITIYTIEKKGKLLNEFEKEVNVKEINDLKEELIWNGKEMLIEYVKKRKFLSCLKEIFLLVYYRITKKDRNELAKNADYLSQTLDIAVSYQVPISPITIFVAEKVNAKKKYLWNHADLISVSTNIIENYKKYFEKYDKIFSVSEKATQNAIKLLPEFENKLETFYNIIDEQEIRRKANEKCEKCFSKYYINIVTVARLAKGKGYDLAINITSKLMNKGYKIKWFAVGDGEEKDSLERLIKEYNVENYFILLGEKLNPYPYIKNADIYVQPSEYEGYSITSSEAKILCKPIITTNTAGANEKFKNGENAIIVNYDENEIEMAIIDLIENKSKREKFINNLENSQDEKSKSNNMIEENF